MTSPLTDGSTVDLTEADLHDTLAQIWQAYLDPETSPVPVWEPVDEAAWTTQARVHAAADISGAWQGTVGVEMGLRLALEVATALYAQPLPGHRATAGTAAIAPDDFGRSEQSLIFDAIGEVVNIVAGNLKALLPQPSTLSLPRVEFLSTHRGATTAGRVAPTAGGLVVDFLCGDQPLRLTVHADQTHCAHQRT